MACVAAHDAVAQSIARRVASADGVVQIVYPSRPDACGDGESFIGNVFGRSTWYSGGTSMGGRGGWYERSCIRGPARIVTTVTNGEITKLRVYVGPLPSSASGQRTITASAADVSAWLGDLIANAPVRLASDAMLPLALADVPDPWTPLLRVARNGDRPLGVRRAALTWLAVGVTDHLGLTDEVPASDDDEMRKQAVFVLSQRPKNESVPELIDLARTARRPIARREAIFWLGQTGDTRAADVYAELLKR
jgi:hypothetical protein